MRWALAIGVVAACGGAGAGASPTSDHPTRDRIREAPVMPLARAVRGSTEHPIPNIAAGCSVGSPVMRAGEWNARVHRFVPPETATYRFSVRAKHVAILDIALTRPGPQENRDILCVGGRAFSALVSLRAGETYAIVIEGQPRGPYEVTVELDRSEKARVRPEDPAIVRELVAAAPALAPGRVLGELASVAGGARARCGGLGTGTVYRLDVTAPVTLALRAATQFPVAIEVRDPAGASLACARSRPGEFTASLAQVLAPGRHVVVVDTTDLAPELFDPLRGSPIRVDLPGAAVRGGFALDVALAAGAP